MSLKSKKSAGIHVYLYFIIRLHYCMCVRCSVHGSQLMLDVRYECCYKILAKIARAISRAISKQQNVPTNVHTVWWWWCIHTHKRSNNQLSNFKQSISRLHCGWDIVREESTRHIYCFQYFQKVGKKLVIIDLFLVHNHK